jgi:chitinase
VTVDFGTANGTATAGEDFYYTSGTLTFAPGQTSQIVTVDVKVDSSPANKRGDGQLQTC